AGGPNGQLLGLATWHVDTRLDSDLTTAEHLATGDPGQRLPTLTTSYPSLEGPPSEGCARRPVLRPVLRCGNGLVLGCGDELRCFLVGCDAPCGGQAISDQRRELFGVRHPRDRRDSAVAQRTRWSRAFTSAT